MRVRRRSFQRSRDRLSTELRDFAAAHGWSVTGAAEALAGRYPLAPLQDGYSAQASLRIEGDWHGRRAALAHVLVRPRPHAPGPATGGRRHRDQEVLLTVALLTGTARRRVVAPEVGEAGEVGEAVYGEPAALRTAVADLLVAARHAGRLLPGESVAVVDGEVVHLGPATYGAEPAWERRLELIVAVAAVADDLGRQEELADYAE